MEPVARPTFSLPSDNQLRLILVTLMGLGFAIYLGMRVGQGDIKFVLGLFLVVALAVVVAAMGKRSWLLLPLGMTLNVSTPLVFGREFSCRELTCMILIAHTVVRVALRQQKLEIFRREHLWPMLYAGWAFLILANNPIGLQSFGAENVGARFYFQIFLGLCSFLIVANLHLAGQDFKWFFVLSIAAACVNIFHGIWYWKSGQAMIGQRINLFEVDESFYTWHQVLVTPSLILVMLIFARFRLKEIVSWQKSYLWGTILLALVVISFSGKRAGVGSMLLLPVIAAVLRRRAGMGTAMVLAMALAVGILAASHGRVLQLPLSTQRALSFLPGNWDHRVSGLGTQDEFRKNMRKIALREIEKHPWIGPGFAMNVKDYWSDIQTFGSQATNATSGHSWHTLWFGIAADFGIPAALIWGLLWIHFTRLSYSLVSRFSDQSWASTMASYIFLFLCWQWSNSYTSGHSAQYAFNSWWIYALLIPVKRMAESGEGDRGGGLKSEV